MDYHISQRLSVKSQLCTVRYIGVVADKPGTWLGVEWDDPARGKHDGTHQGKRYFECRSSSPTAASFLKPNQPWDKPRTFLRALREKYMPENAGTGGEIVYFSSKQAEEVGFEKFAKRQAQLQGIHVIVLDYMRIHWDADQDDREEITKLCSHVTELDVGSNLFESLDEILTLVSALPKLTRLTLDGNRFDPAPNRSILKSKSGVTTLGLSNTCLTWHEVTVAAERFPNLTSLSADKNQLNTITEEVLPPKLKHLSLSNNSFTALSDLRHLALCPNLETLALKHCSISDLISGSPVPSNDHCLSTVLHSLDLRQNAVSSWSFFNGLEATYPALKHLQISGNTLYQDLVSAEDKPLTSEDGYMLTIARLPQLQTLNHSQITAKERLNAETYYLNRIASVLSASPTAQHAKILQNHPRWTALCIEYGEPSIQQEIKAEDLDPNTFAAKLVKITFLLPTSEIWTQELPKSLSIYSFLGIVGKKLSIMPLSLRLLWVTEEKDYGVPEKLYTGPEWWDSSDEEEEEVQQAEVQREMELVPGTRPLGTYIEGGEAKVRVEIIQYG